MNKLCTAIAAGSLCFALQANAEHSDIEIASEGGQIVVETVAPIDFITGNLIFEGDFGDFAFGPYETDDPGFATHDGLLNPNEILNFEATGSLLFWNGASWLNSVPDQETVRLTDAWGVDTLFSTSGVVNGATTVIDQASGTGGIHAHLHFILENDAGIGTPAVGAYMIELVLFGSNGTGGPITSAASDPFFIAFNSGLSPFDFESAIDARVAAVPIPGAGLLMISALGLLGGVARRRR